ncbi:zinc-binding alcohol dehydrogenase family protein [Aspergillus affinis]|uniref:zinc-binding alcohol dehydrogenase family protein n=1 Tax=Aspergillus affinis TaxID=1070780 RepID=UPI0022FEE66A|nr:uncharacterized protein KD926_000959 [Aspergillus affinis]KAI9044358.1 hypothetical protein KD926_000959 [Aspergillus affinis]
MATPKDNISLHVDETLSYSVKHGLEWQDPKDGEFLVETYFSGANPSDTKHATDMGIYPVVLGYDYCGKVLKTPPNSPFQPGQIVAGYTQTGLGRPLRYGTHQKYLSGVTETAFVVPENLPKQHAACLGVVTMTASDAIFNHFQIPLPTEPAQNLGPLLIWGVSTSVGISALQLARASGISPIFVTASPERHALLRELGATHCFDYKSPTVVSEIKEALKTTESGAFRYALDAIGARQDGGSAQSIAACSSDETALASVVVQFDPRFKLPLAAPNQDVSVQIQGIPQPITIPARYADYERAWKGVLWAAENYGKQFRFPSVKVFKGTAEEALEELKVVGDHGRGFGKLALQHPL